MPNVKFSKALFAGKCLHFKHVIFENWAHMDLFMPDRYSNDVLNVPCYEIIVVIQFKQCKNNVKSLKWSLTLQDLKKFSLIQRQ